MSNFEDALSRMGIPYVVVGATSFYEREEIRDMLVGYLALVINPHDDVAFLRVVNVPPRGVGPATLLKLSSRPEKKSLLSLPPPCVPRAKSTPRWCV